MTHRIVERVTNDTVHLPSQDAAVEHCWSPETEAYVLANSKQVSVEEMADILCRTVKAVKNKAFLMGCSIQSKGKMPKLRWTPDDLKYLKSSWGHVDTVLIAEHLSRTVAAVSRKAFKTGCRVQSNISEQL